MKALELVHELIGSFGDAVKKLDIREQQTRPETRSKLSTVSSANVYSTVFTHTLLQQVADTATTKMSTPRTRITGDAHMEDLYLW
jgi:hypothetical protein